MSVEGVVGLRALGLGSGPVGVGRAGAGRARAGLPGAGPLGVAVLGVAVLGAGPAAAAEPAAEPPPTLVYGGDAARVVPAAAAAMGRSPWELRAVRPGELAVGAPPRLAGVAPPACPAPTTNAGLRSAVSLAEGLVSYQRWDEAARATAAFPATLACLGEPAEASLGGRAWMLAGVVAAMRGQAASATAAFGNALSWQPELRWEDEFAPPAREAFLAAQKARGAGTSLRLGPGVGPGALLWIDGRKAEPRDGVVPLAVGEHLVQLLDGGRAHTLSAPVDGAAELLLLDPAHLGEADLARLATEPGRAAWGEVFESLGLDEAWAVEPQAGVVWHLGPRGWEEAAAGRARACPESRRCTGRVLLGAGLATTATGLGVFGAAQLSYLSHTDDVATYEDGLGADVEGRSALVAAYGELVAEHQAGRRATMFGGLGVAGAGVALSVVGWRLGVPGDVTVAAAPVRGGAAVALGGRW